MLDPLWKELKSGTDVRGVACEGIPNEKINLTDSVVERITAAFVVWLSQKVEKKPDKLTISLGHDSRISADRIEQAAVRALKGAGIKIFLCGLASTPSMFMTTVDLSCDGAIQITASHHPWNRNGLKFFTRNGGLDSSDLEEVLALAQAGKKAPEKMGSAVPCDYMKTYATHLRKMICDGIGIAESEKPLKNMHIVVDAGNGAGGFYANDVLAPLGADISGSQFLDPDGHFPNHIPNPENEEAMASICKAVRNVKADLGVIFDTDVDRGGAVDASGEEINRNRLVAVASAIALESHPGGTIVTDSITSTGLKDYIEKTLGGIHHRFKRGYKNVINEAIRLNNQGIDCPLAIETSGHAAMRENYFLDDGAYLVTKIIIKTAALRREGKSLEDLLAPLAEPQEAAEIRIPISQEDARKAGQIVIDHLTDYAEKQEGWSIAPDNREGIRISFDKAHGNGWMLLRLSVHDPILPLNMESDSKGGVRTIAEEANAFLKKESGIDLSPLEEFLRK